MSYCTNCRKEFTGDANFCPYCGTAIKEEPESKRKTVYEGTIHKCPNCGEVIGAFTTNCPTCGFEFRNTQASSAVKYLAEKIEKIENNRSVKQSGWKKLFDTKGRISETDQEKISLIRSFVIPNSKEDLFEFMVLASSNINIQRYSNSSALSASERAVSDAWYSKFEQSYEKAKLSIGDTPEFEKIQNIFTKKKKEIRHATRQFKTTIALLIILPIALYCILVLWVTNSLRSDDVQKENDRLNALASEIYEEIDSKNFDMARAKAANLVYTGPNTTDGKQSATKWEQTKKELLSIIASAEEANKEVERSSAQSITPVATGEDATIPSNNSSSPVPDDFYKGYTAAIFSDYDSPTAKNGLSGARIYFTGTLKKTEILKEDNLNYIVGYLTDSDSNTWILLLNVIPIVEETHYDTAVGKEITCTAVYIDYSDSLKMPMAVVNELFILDNGARLNGLQTILDAD